jgi:hypothetical protein
MMPAIPTPPAASAATAIHFHFRPLLETNAAEDLLSGASEMYCEQMVPARESPFAAVIRI